jgi:hypothetical protein
MVEIEHVIASANLEEPHHHNAVVHIECEAVVNTSGDGHEVTSTRVATNPTLSRVFCIALISGELRH